MRVLTWCLGVVLIYGGSVGYTLADPLSSDLGGDRKEVWQRDEHRLKIVTQKGITHDFVVELAITPEQQRRGLMFRTNLAHDAGMLFDFKEPRIISMWMKNTLIPLDMIFVDEAGRVVFIAENTTPESTDIISSSIPVRWVLEVYGGITSKLEIGDGDQLIGLNMQ